MLCPSAEDKPSESLLMQHHYCLQRKKKKAFFCVYIDTQCRFMEGPIVKTVIMGEQSWTSACFYHQGTETSDSSRAWVREGVWGSRACRGFTTRSDVFIAHTVTTSGSFANMSNTVYNWCTGFWWMQHTDPCHWALLWYVFPSRAQRASHHHCRPAVRLHQWITGDRKLLHSCSEVWT